MTLVYSGSNILLRFQFVIVAKFPDRPFLKVFFLGFSKEVTEVTETLVDIEVLWEPWKKMVRWKHEWKEERRFTILLCAGLLNKRFCQWRYWQPRRVYQKDLLAKPMIDWIAIHLYLINDLWTSITKKCIFFWEINTNSQ